MKNRNMCFRRWNIDQTAWITKCSCLCFGWWWSVVAIYSADTETQFLSIYAQELGIPGSGATHNNIYKIFHFRWMNTEMRKMWWRMNLWKFRLGYKKCITTTEFHTEYYCPHGSHNRTRCVCMWAIRRFLQVSPTSLDFCFIRFDSFFPHIVGPTQMDFTTKRQCVYVCAVGCGEQSPFQLFIGLYFFTFYMISKSITNIRRWSYSCPMSMCIMHSSSHSQYGLLLCTAMSWQSPSKRSILLLLASSIIIKTRRMVARLSDVSSRCEVNERWSSRRRHSNFLLSHKFEQLDCHIYRLAAEYPM